jgi:hypothetical protein
MIAESIPGSRYQGNNRWIAFTNGEVEKTL